MSLLSAIGGLIGLAVGGPLGAAFGSGIGTLAGGGDIKDALKAGVLGFGIGSIPGAQNFLQGAAGSLGMAGGGGGGASGGPLAALFGGGGAGVAGGGAGGMGAAMGGGAKVNPLAALTGGGGGAGATGFGGGIMGFAQQNPLVMAALMQAAEPSRDMLSPEQKRMLATGERLPDYQGTAAPDYRMPGVAARPGFAVGGYIEGPGTGTSDSIPARIYQNGGPVQEAMLSDGEFVMTERAVRGAGGGDRNAGAAKMYEMMSNLERRA
jgi:hypothetical protein